MVRSNIRLLWQMAALALALPVAKCLLIVRLLNR